ncbi:MAG: hypothetical protein N3A69_04475, partial [Leptospiraceae bacterium]|nr:hypothetical protein [Leptospiraceae bacterium]
QHRIVQLLKEEVKVDSNTVERLSNFCFVYQNMSLKKVFTLCDKIGFSYPNARIIDKEISRKDLRKLAELVDVEAISFANPEYEKYWTIQNLGYGDTT